MCSAHLRPCYTALSVIRLCAGIRLDLLNGGIVMKKSGWQPLFRAQKKQHILLLLCATNKSPWILKLKDLRYIKKTKGYLYSQGTLFGSIKVRSPWLRHLCPFIFVLRKWFSVDIYSQALPFDLVINFTKTSKEYIHKMFFLLLVFMHGWYMKLIWNPYANHILLTLSKSCPLSIWMKPNNVYNRFTARPLPNR